MFCVCAKHVICVRLIFWEERCRSVSIVEEEGWGDDEYEEMTMQLVSEEEDKVHEEPMILMTMSTATATMTTMLSR